MEAWWANNASTYIWPATLLVGVVLVALLWLFARATYTYLSATLSGLLFMFPGFGLLLYCSYALISAAEFTPRTIFVNGVGIIVGIGAIGAGAYGIRNASDF